ncbi:hypothetical protein HKBW3S44_00585 [Candidatus Hakubella thermalkaliphila]|uniref:Glycosyltransferase subfamily 4-like N-terminal domain-containing protein n=1 Tax=Candidatus Hakubella thermalkaliphila TaxID=2754717 RepID=A0A6V8PYM5_9ACTN|nr:glycosyltransferase family 4 protein [Candidatus Hakubella thermalkaliphila]GFP22647.1 hypothetical protein HKBW3S09_00115 [Candidatus Hakubella thermalkaliphila]GFP29553.1 hypothetical protein HKBW3S34_00473 [Candidatus Hakubella thermalkaliphila]GFP36904.1 hypothetical protein HKBW3S44_00585 [Candidatus Hakubella thermalkaliphila]GFP38541.1 hypothetical protein HKBW3S47_00242 [Candidatus Hakubella thermalkaliphila]GFP43274.1 hypothetical protein HKBW3C_02404 [Candidatus Hakubella thermalk
MKILYVALNQSYKAKHAGFTHVYNVARAFQKRGHEVQVALKPGGADRKKGATFQEDGLVYHLEDWSALIVNLPRFIISFISALGKVRRWKKECGLDLIYERYELTRTHFGIIGKLLGIPTLLEVNIPILEVRFGKKKVLYKILKIFQKAHFSLYQGLITQTESLKNILQDDFKKEIVVVPNGADPQLFKPQPGSDEKRADLGLGQEERVIGFVGSFMPWHGLQDLVDAFEIVCQKDNSVRLLVIGGSRDQIGQLIEGNRDKRALKKIIFLGEIDYPLIPAYLDLCQVLVAPFNTKRDEGRRKLYDKYGFWWCPIKLFEYMAMARPVVVSDVGEITAYLDGAGLTYREGDTRGLAESILRLLNNLEESSRMGERGRRLILEKYSWELHARRIEQILTALA